MAAAISPAQDAEHATTPQEDDGSDDDDDNDADNDDDDDGSGDGNGDGNGTRKYKQRRLKRPLNHHQAAIVYTASHEWKKVELEILARGLAIGETAKLIVGGTEAKASCIVTKYHTKGPNAETYRVLSPPPLKCRAATAGDVDKPVFVTMQESGDAPFGMGHRGLLRSVQGARAVIEVRGQPVDVLAKCVRIQPAEYPHVPRDRLERVPPQFPREYSTFVLAKCEMKPGSHQDLTCIRKAMNKNLKRSSRAQKELPEKRHCAESLQRRTAVAYPLILQPW